jgi:hypothetical protein
MFFVLATILLTFVKAADGSLSTWQFFAELNHAGASPGIYTVTVPLQVLDKSQADLADIRLIDSSQHEVPYALRIRRDIDQLREVTATAFNQSSKGTTTEISLDLGENPVVHNEVKVDTSGSNFRRRVEVEGSDNGKDWKLLKTGDLVFRFQSQNSTVESDRVSYPVSRYRFLHVRVFADDLTDKIAPSITQLQVSMSAREKGELTSWTASISGPQLFRNQGAPASSWTIDLGYAVPCSHLMLNIDQPSFSRPFQLDAIDDPQNPRLLASGELIRRLDEPKKPLTIVLDSEDRVRKLRLLVTDYNNETLRIESIDAAAPARQLMFELTNPANQPLRAYFGNPQATAPHYDFEKDVSTKLSASANVLQAQLEGVEANPDYKPEPLPLTERVPWLIYLVLSASSVALALVLISLARKSLRSAPAQSEADRSAPA